MKRVLSIKTLVWWVAMMLTALSTAQASLLVQSGLFDVTTNQYFQVQSVRPADPFDSSIAYSRSDTFDLADPNTRFLTGGYSTTGVAQYGRLTASIGGSVAGTTSFPWITMFSSVFFFDTLTFNTPNRGSGTAYLQVTLDGFGSATDSNGPGVYGRAYGGFGAGPVGSVVYQFPTSLDVTNTSKTTTLLSQPIPFTSGIPVDIEVGLGTQLWLQCGTSVIFPNACNNWAGQGATDFSHTALLTGIQVFDTTGAPISNFDISSTSGTAYGANGLTSPEPETYILGLSALLLFGAFRYGKRQIASANQLR